jgi:hypothetical protein
LLAKGIGAHESKVGDLDGDGDLDILQKDFQQDRRVDVWLNTSKTAGKRVLLWNGRDFTGWKLFLGKTDVDVKDVWSVRKGVIHCKGVPNGYMRTEKDYANYHLHLEWRWPGKPTNSGVLLHMTGPDQVWPRCIESQLMSGHAGDFWLLFGTGITVDGKPYGNKPGNNYVNVKKKAPSSENPPGEWNTYDIYCIGATVRNVVNGVEQNYGTNASVSSGKICLQSEGSPIEFRNVFIIPIR